MKKKNKRKLEREKTKDQFIHGELKDFGIEEKYLKSHGFNYLGSQLQKFKIELNNRASDLTRLEKNELPLILKPYDLCEFFNIDYFTLKKYCLIKKEVTSQESNYRSFRLKKKGTGYRHIAAPKKKLKQIQTKLNEMILNKIEPSEYAHGFRKNYSIVSNARIHLNSEIIYNLDLKDFFTSIKFDKVIQVFKTLGYSGLISSLLSRLCTIAPRFYSESRKMWVIYNKRLPHLPQGACTSPNISNLVCIDFDRSLNEVAKNYKFKYSRYADDITFSSTINKKINKAFRNEVFRCIKKYNFRVNLKKENYSRNFKPRVVTGVVVHKKELTLPRYWIRNLRAAIHQLKYLDIEKEDIEIKEMLANIEGRCAYATMVNKEKYSHFYYEFQYLKNFKFKNIV